MAEINALFYYTCILSFVVLYFSFDFIDFIYFKNFVKYVIPVLKS